MDSRGLEQLPTRVIAGRTGVEIPMVQMVVVDGPDRGLRFALARGTANVGTAPLNDLRLTDTTVSRLHAEIEVQRDRVRVRDSGSTNGTFINGVRVDSAYLPAGASLRVGDTTIVLEVGDEPLFVELSTKTSFGGMIGASVEMRRLYALIEKVAPTDATVLIQGETGTGKELVARAIHDASNRRSGPFVAIDCGAIPESLMESELFGHVRGAFTGATVDRAGAFEEADGGTLFFDEIGELPILLQRKLLRVLETREVRKVGGSPPKHADVRVLAATNRNLSSSVNEGLFREDLFYRLAVVSLALPPLRTRRDDIPLLARHFIERFSGEARAVPPSLLPSLVTRGWPGNVRELRNYLERWVLLERTANAAEAGQSAALPLPSGLELLVPTDLPLKEARHAWTARFEDVYVRAILAKTGNNITKAAELAGVNRRFLQRLMDRLGMRGGSDDE